MQCVIHSKIRQTTNIFNQLLNSNSKEVYTIHSLLRDISKKDLEKINHGNGILLNVNGYKCIATCFHIVGKANININITLKNKFNTICTESCRIVASIEEYEISILEFTNKKNIKKYDFFEFSNIDVFDKTEIDKYVLQYISEEGLIDTTLQLNSINISNITINNVYLKSTSMPKIPMFDISSRYFPNDINGLSGSLLINKNTNNPLGIVSHSLNNTNVISCIPLSIVVFFISELALNNFIVPQLTSIVIEGGYGNVVIDDKSVCCHIISEDINTDILNIGYSTHQKKKNFKFNKCDVIFKVNDLNFNDDGTIYYSKINLNVNFNTYFMFESIYEKYVKLEIFRQDKNSEYPTVPNVNVSIKGTLLSDVFNVSILNDNKYILHNGFVFSEISDELITELVNSSVVDMDFFNIKSIKQKKTKLVMIYDGNDVDIIEKIGQKKINSLDDIKIIKQTDKLLQYKTMFNKVII